MVLFILGAYVMVCVRNRPTLTCASWAVRYSAVAQERVQSACGTGSRREMHCTLWRATSGAMYLRAARKHVPTILALASDHCRAPHLLHGQARAKKRALASRFDDVQSLSPKHRKPRGRLLRATERRMSVIGGGAWSEWNARHERETPLAEKKNYSVARHGVAPKSAEKAPWKSGSSQRPSCSVRSANGGTEILPARAMCMG